MHISERSVERPVATLMLFIALCLLGAFGFSHLSVDLLPDISIPRLVIETRFPGSAPEEVETQITEPIESQFATLRSLKNIHSISKSGIALVTLEFNWGTRMDHALLEVREKLDDLSYALPESAGRPNLLRFDPASDPIMTLAVSSDRLQNPENQRDATEALMELKNFVASIVKRRVGANQRRCAGRCFRRDRTRNQGYCRCKSPQEYGHRTESGRSSARSQQLDTAVRGHDPKRTLSLFIQGHRAISDSRRYSNNHRWT